MYLTLEEDKRIRNRIKFQDIQTDTHFQLGKDMLDEIKKSVSLFMEGDESSFYPDYFQAPVFLVSDRMKEVLEMYEPTLVFRTVILNNVALKTQNVYYLVVPDEVDCLSEESEFYPNGWEKHVVVDEEKLEGRRVFQIKGLRNQKLYIKLEIAESILQRGMQGIVFHNPLH